MLQEKYETTLSIEYKDQIERIRRRFGHDTSSHAFNTLFIWRNSVGNRLHLEESLFSVNYTAKGHGMWMFPCGDEERKRLFIREHLEQPDFGLCYVRQADKEFLEEWFPGVFQIEAAPGDSEYLIDRMAHVQLKGSKYAKLRGKMNKVAASFSVSTKLLSEDTLSDAIEVTADWLDQKACVDALTLSGDQADRIGLHMFRKLGITGIVLYLEGRPFGVVAGFPLSEDTYDIYLAKEKERLPGLGYYLKRELLLVLPEQYVYVNLEDDLGIEGLATMKKQMIPVKMNEMWVARHVSDK